MDLDHQDDNFIKFQSVNKYKDEVYVRLTDILCMGKCNNRYYVKFKDDLFYNGSTNEFVDNMIIDQNPLEVIKKYKLKGKLE